MSDEQLPRNGAANDPEALMALNVARLSAVFQILDSIGDMSGMTDEQINDVQSIEDGNRRAQLLVAVRNAAREAKSQLQLLADSAADIEAL